MNPQIHEIKHLLVPHRANSYRPHLFRHHYLAIYLIILLVLQISLGTIFHTPQPPLRELSAIEEEVLLGVNAKRAEAGLTRLGRNAALDAAAEDKAMDMLAKNYFDHISPDGKQPKDFVSGHGYIFNAVGENLARGFDEGPDVVRAWENSEAHRKIMLSAQFTETGLAVVNGTLEEKETVIYVQIFASPGGSRIASFTSSPLLSGTAKFIPHLSALNPLLPARLPALVIAAGIFMLLVFDGFMLRRLEKLKALPHHHHRWTFPLAILVGILFLVALFSNLGEIL